MTSREKVLGAFEHHDMGAVPVDFSAHRSSGISPIAYARLRDHLGLPGREIRVYDPIQQLAVVDADVLDRFGVDAVELGRAFAVDGKDWRPWTLPDGSPCAMPAWVKLERQTDAWAMRSVSGTVIGRMPDGALYFEQSKFPFAESDDLDAIPRAFEECMWTSSIAAAPPGPLTAGPDGESRLKEGAARLRASTDRAIVGLFGGNLLEIGQFLYRIDNFLAMLAGEPEHVHAFLDRLVEIHLANLERFLGAVGPHIDVILFGDDLGMQTGPQMSPRMYREYFKPRHAKMWRRAKELAPVKVMLHACGSLRKLLPDLIDAGLDAVNPVQITCAGMDARELKAEFGDRLTFWGGGCDTRQVLPSAAPDEVRRHVRGQIEAFAPGGGFVFQQVHNILADVPPENIAAMFGAVRTR